MKWTQNKSKKNVYILASDQHFLNKKLWSLGASKPKEDEDYLGFQLQPTAPVTARKRRRIKRKLHWTRTHYDWMENLKGPFYDKTNTAVALT